MNGECCVLNKNAKSVLICFGGMALKMGLMPPFEFFNYLSGIYGDVLDLYFFRDLAQCWYHIGINGISKNIDETKEYLDKIIGMKKYNRVIMMGVSSGGYASILFGSLCGVTDVIAFKPRTTHELRMKDIRYYDLKKIINDKTRYILYGDTNVKRKNSDHHISQCERLVCKNVILKKYKGLYMKELRNDGTIKDELDMILNIID